jgi:hypothetical protein
VKPNPNLAMVERIATALGDLRERVVFLGGCATGLLLTDPAAPALRTTRDVDVVIEVGSRVAYWELGKEMTARGFRPDHSEGAPICRWVFEGLLLDLMPSDATLLGFGNRWYPDAIRSAWVCPLASGQQIRVVAPPYFLATKLDAFNSRGGGDYLASHDLEDLVAVIDGRPEILDEVAAADPKLKAFIAFAFATLLADSTFPYALQGHLPPDAASQNRLPRLLQRMQNIAKLG